MDIYIGKFFENFNIKYVKNYVYSSEFHVPNNLTEKVNFSIVSTSNMKITNHISEAFRPLKKSSMKIMTFGNFSDSFL